MVAVLVLNNITAYNYIMMFREYEMHFHMASVIIRLGEFVWGSLE